MLKLKNSYLTLPNNFYQKAEPAVFPEPSLIAFNHDLATEIGLDVTGLSTADLAQVFSGQQPIDNSPPIALAYAGFQFGHPVPQLGDGRAHLLGESSGFDIQLKGSGPTPYSRGGDGKSALGPVLREYIVSEAMHRLGVPTTRALCAVRTGEEVLRQDGPEPGGVFTRVAASHLRVGTFQFFSFQQDSQSVKTLLNYTVNRHYPDLNKLPTDEKAIELLKALTHKQAQLVARWSALGFIHGVMNTDNFSMAGVTIDYGPCAFMEEFSFEKVFSSIDRNGRYAFTNQVPMAKWNLLRLAECLVPLIADQQEKAVARVEKEVLPLFETFEKKRTEHLARKLGITDYRDQDEKLVMQFLNYLQRHVLDFTLAFYHLPALHRGDDSFYTQGEDLFDFVQAWKTRVPRLGDLKVVNPLYIPRNHLVQKAIEHAYQEDDSYFHRLNRVLSQPFDNQEGAEDFAKPAEPNERVYHTFCGT
jgi:uncharacterized protein YdiU (UPF0061 family)